MCHSIQFLDSNQFFFKNGSVYYYRPGKSYLDKFMNGLSLDSVIYTQLLSSLATKPSTKKCISSIIEAKPLLPNYDYDEHTESDNKFVKSSYLPTHTKRKMSKREFLETKKPASKKLACVPKHSKIVHLKARATKLWHQGEYAKTNPPSHDDDCVCLSCIIYRDEAETMKYMQDIALFFNTFVGYDDY